MIWRTKWTICLRRVRLAVRRRRIQEGSRPADRCRRDRAEHHRDKTDSRRAVRHHRAGHRRDKTDSHRAARHRRDRAGRRRDKTDSRRAVQRRKGRTDSRHAVRLRKDRAGRRDKEDQVHRITVRHRMYHSKEGRRQRVCSQMTRTIWILLIFNGFYAEKVCACACLYQFLGKLYGEGRKEREL